MCNRLLLLALLGAVSCAAPPKDGLTVVVPQRAEAVAALPVRADDVLPSHAIVVGAIDVRRLDDKIGRALHDLGPMGLAALARLFDVPGDVLDLTDLGGVGAILGLDTSRPLTFALQGASDAERRAAEDVGKLGPSASFAALAYALADTPSASLRGRLLLPSSDVTVTMGRVRALLKASGLEVQPNREGVDARFASARKDIVVELTRGRTSLTVDVVRCYGANPPRLARAVDDAFARLREPGGVPRSMPVANRTLRVDYQPEPLAVLNVAVGAHAIHAALSSVDEPGRDATAAQGVIEVTQSLRLARDRAGVYFDQVALYDDATSGHEAVVLSAHPAAERPRHSVESRSIMVPLAGRPETLDVNRAFLDGLNLPGANLSDLLGMIRQAGVLSFAVALPSLLPWMARDQLGPIGYGPGPLFQESVRTRFERFGLTSTADMQEGLYYGLLPRGTSPDSAACSLAKSIACSPGERLRIGITRKYVGPYSRFEQDGSSVLVVSYARLVAVGDHFAVLAANDKKLVDGAKAPVFSAEPRPPAYSETSLGTLGSLAGVKLPNLPDRAIAITATEADDCSGCAKTSPGVMFTLSGR